MYGCVCICTCMIVFVHPCCCHSTSGQKLDSTLPPLHSAARVWLCLFIVYLFPISLSVDRLLHMTHTL